jgi:hypothetical protein
VSRDNQKSALYRWENHVVGPRAPRTIKFEDAQTFVNGIFICEGLLYPPKVELISKRATKVWATGSRQILQLRPVTPAWVILHELAHAITTEVDKSEEGHGPDFVGIYIKLLDKYCGIPLPLSMYTLQNTKIEYNLGAKARFAA